VKKKVTAKWPEIPRGWDLSMLTGDMIIYERKNDWLKVRLREENGERKLSINRTAVSEADKKIIEKFFGG